MKPVSSVLFILLATFVSSQENKMPDTCDTLITKANDTLVVRIVELTATELSYSSCDTSFESSDIKWVKRNDIKEIIVHNEMRKNKYSFNVSPSFAETGISCNFIPYSRRFNTAGDLRLRVREGDFLRHFINLRMGYNQYEAASKPYQYNKDMVASIGYHAELKKGHTRWRISYGCSVLILRSDEQFSAYTSPYGTTSDASHKTYYQFGVVPSIGIQCYLSDYLYLQINLEAGPGTLSFATNDSSKGNWVSLASSQFPGIALFGRINRL